jgi:adenylate cyclase
VTETAGPAVEAGTSRLWPGIALLVGAGMLALLLLHPGFDEAWENHPAHFWLVFTAAALSVGLGYAVGVAARRRRDARLFLVSLAFVSAAGFLGLHALATPGVLLGKNAGFELATPFGLAVAGVFAGASGLPLRPRAAERVLHWAWLLVAALSALLAGWAAISLSGIEPWRASSAPRSWTAGRSRSRHSASCSMRPLRSATSTFTGAAARSSCSESR